MIADTDSSDYGPLDSAMNDPRGLLIAIPHHGHYVLSMASLAAKISLRREVLVFYGDPKTHPGNEIFDDLHVLIYEGAESRVTIIHDNRAGLSKAIRALQNGSAVLIMPDVYKDLDDTFQLPFCGRPYDVMLGTAALARRTHSNILPTVAIPIRPGIRFANQFGPLLHGRQPNSVTAAVTSFEDYKVTAAMFHAFEAIMDSEIHHWQFVRQHYQRSGSFPVLDEDQLESLTELVLRSSKVALNPSAAIDCSNCVEAIEWNDTTRWN
ncbi:MAG: hypothetical protein IPH76_01895 [Xanthomonadales bacterium]|nr:hypothetical protein [Xanthomonadales bacterium]